MEEDLNHPKKISTSSGKQFNDELSGIYQGISFRTILDNSVHWESWQLPDGEFIYHSPAFEVFSGYETHNFTGHIEKILGIIHPEDRQGYKSNFQELINKRASSEFNFRIIDTKGQVKWIKSANKVVYDDNGNVIGLRRTNIHITSQMLAEHELSESAEASQNKDILLKSILDSPRGINIFSLDRHFCYTVFSLSHKISMKRIWNAEIRVGMNILDLISRAEVRKMAKENFERTLKGENITIVQGFCDHEEKQTFWENTYSPVYDKKETIVGITAFVNEITDRVFHEKQLHLSEQRFRALIENSDDAFSLIDISGKVIYHSPSYTRVMGHTIQSREFKNMLELVHPDEKEKISGLFKRITDKGGKFEISPTRVLHGDGSWHWIEGFANNLLSEPGIEGIMVNFRDITKRRLAEIALKESREKLNVIFNNSADGIVLVDNVGDITEWNKGSQRITGLTVDEVYGRKVWEIQYQLASAEIKEKYSLADIKALWDYQLLSLVENETKIMHGQIIDANGQHKFVEDLASALIINNKKFIAVIQRDITERKQAELALAQSEGKYKSIIENLTDIYYRADADGKLVMVSPSCLKIFGYSTMDEVIGKNLEIIYKNPDERAGFIKMLKESGRIQNYRTILLRRDGTEVYVETTANILFDAEGSYSGVEGIVRDITDRMHAEKALRESEANLREINATKDKLFSIIAHDLKSPFTSILGFSELLANNMEKYGIEESKEYMGYINTSAKNTLALLENLLAWAKAQSGQMILKTQRLEVYRVVQEIIDVLNASAKIKGISLVNHPSNRIEIVTDQNILQTVLRNLISNAIKYSYTHGEVIIKSLSFDKTVEIQVQDEGMGMEQELIDNLFRIDKNIVMRGTANEKGSGLGLLLCKELIEKLNGKIKVQSQKEKGSILSFTIPVPDEINKS